MQFEQLTPAQPPEFFDEVARIHINEIHHGLLPLLGLRFLSRLYYELCITSQTVIWIATENGKVVGFLAGCANVAQSLRSVLMRSPVRLMWLGSRSIFNLRLLRKLPAVFWYPLRVKSSAEAAESSDSAAGSAELLAIAVDATVRGRAVGKQLVALFEDSLRQWGVTEYHVTTNIEEANSNAFYRALSFQPCGLIKHHDLTLQKYRKKTS